MSSEQQNVVFGRPAPFVRTTSTRSRAPGISAAALVLAIAAVLGAARPALSQIFVVRMGSDLTVFDNDNVANNIQISVDAGRVRVDEFNVGVLVGGDSAEFDDSDTVIYAAGSVTKITVAAQGGGDTIVLQGTAPGVTQAVLSGGDAGDSITINGTSTTTTTAAVGGAGNDTITINGGGGPQIVAAGQADADTIIVNNTQATQTIVSGDTDATTLVDAIQELDGGDDRANATIVGNDTITINDASGSGLIVLGGPLDDTIRVVDTHTTASTQILGNGGGDTLIIDDAHTPQLVASGGDGTDQITVNDTHATSTAVLGDGGADDVDVLDAHGTTLVLNGGDAADVFDVFGVGSGGTRLSTLAIVGEGSADTTNIRGPIVLSAGYSIDVESTVVMNGGTLAGSGVVTGALSVLSGGAVAPGSNNRIGALTAGNTTFAAGSTYAVQIEGTVPGTSHDFLGITGTLSLQNATLSLSGTHVPQPNEAFLIISNDGADAAPLAGAFAGLPEGAPIIFNGVPLYITYTGGDGNDVVLFGPPTFTVTDVTVTEMDNGDPPAPMIFVVARSHNVGSFTVTWAFADDTATSFGIPPNLDYVDPGVTVSPLQFPTGGTVALPVVAVAVPDEIVELTEQFFLNLLSAPGAIIADPQGIGTIENDDRGFIEITDVTMNEGDSGPTLFTFIATLSHAVDVPVTITYTTVNGTATPADDDYMFAQFDVVFAAVTPGEMQLITVVVNGDKKFEPDETFTVVMSNIQAQGRNITFSDDTGLGTILNDDEQGACCLPADGSCHVTDGIGCGAAGGIYQGDGSNCGTPCPQPPTGACCFFDGTCQTLTDLQCTSQGAFFQGDGTACAAVVCTAPATNARGTISARGSLLYFTKVELRWDGTEPFALRQDTFLSVTNDAEADVKFQMEFVNGDAPLDAVRDPLTGAVIERAHPGWNSLDNAFVLTAHQPVYWSALTGDPAGLGLSSFTALDPGTPPGRPAMDGTTDRVLRGFIIGWAVDSDGREIKWNNLAGNGTILDYRNGSSWEYPTMNYAVVSPVSEGAEPDGTPGRLLLDGTEYAAAFDELLFNFQAATSTAWAPGGVPRPTVTDTDLTLMPLSADLRQNNTGPVTTLAEFTVWNENEVKVSGTERCVTCWDQTLISLYDLPNPFLPGLLNSDHGKAIVRGIAATECNVPLGTFSRRAALGGVAARVLTFDPGLATQDVAQAGYVLVARGRAFAIIRYGLPTAAGSGTPALELPFAPTDAEIRGFVEEVLRRYGR